MSPSRIARCTTAWASPSISRKNRPGTSVASTPAARRAWRRTTLRCQGASSSIDRIPISAGGDEAEDQRGAEGAPEAVDREPVVERAGEQHDQAVQDQHADPEREDGEREREADQQRPEDRVEDRDRERGADDAGGAVGDLHAGQDPGGEEQRRDGRDERQQRAAEHPAAARLLELGVVRRARGRPGAHGRISYAPAWAVTCAKTRPKRSGSTTGPRTCSSAHACCASVVVGLPWRFTA